MRSAVLDLTIRDADFMGCMGGFIDGTFGYVVLDSNDSIHWKFARVNRATFGGVAFLVTGFMGGFCDGTSWLCRTVQKWSKIREGGALQSHHVRHRCLLRQPEVLILKVSAAASKCENDHCQQQHAWHNSF